MKENVFGKSSEHLKLSTKRINVETLSQLQEEGGMRKSKNQKIKNKKIKNEKNLETRSVPNLGKRILKISNTPPNTNPTRAKSKIKNQKIKKILRPNPIPT